MNTIVDEVWNTIVKAVEKMQTNSDEVVLYKDAESLFKKDFLFFYEMIEQEFMAKPLEEEHTLDRHKVAAIIICSVLKSKIVGVSQKYTEACKNKEFLGNEKIAIEIALSYMNVELKRCFDKGQVPYEKLFGNYVLPKPYSCNRKYGEVICRDIYLSAPFFGLNPLLIANLMFFIEEYSFAINGIKRIEKE